MERFWSKVEITDDGSCWEWLASKRPDGYGQFNIEGKPLRAHRVAYELVKGPIPKGLELDHLCRNPGCVNPYHLEPVTHKENVRRGSSNAGELYEPKTHCLNGHPRTPENLYKGGQCKICKREYDKECYQRKKCEKAAVKESQK